MPAYEVVEGYKAQINSARQHEGALKSKLSEIDKLTDKLLWG